MYLNSLNVLHKLQDLEFSQFSNTKLKSVLRGAENSECRTNYSNNVRLPVTFNLLRILGNQIAKSSMNSLDKQVVWTACTWGFFGSFRMGEILPKSQNFDSKSTLLWQDIKIFEDKIIVHVKSTKTRDKGGVFVDLFLFSGFNCCPVRSLLALKKMSKNVQNDAIFKLSNGKVLTPSNFSFTVKELLRPVLAEKANYFSAHSFRAGIPSTIPSSTLSKDDVMFWGRWKSDSFELYSKNASEKRKQIFKKIESFLKK